MKLKSSVTYELSMTEYLHSEEEKTKREFSIQVNSAIVSYVKMKKGK